MTTKTPNLQTTFPDLPLENGTADPTGQLHAELKAVLEAGGPHIVFQPIVELRGSRIIGVEALARFGLEPELPPEFWFRFAGGAGVRTELELAAAKKALKQFQRIPSEAFVSINVSPSTLASEEFAEVFGVIPPNRLALEVTETAVIENYDVLRKLLQPFREGGAKLVCDDAGSGFASLRHILQLAPDIIKLDVTVTRGILADPSDRAMATALISFAKEMNTTVVAEGIERPEECDELIAMGVRFGQGFFLGRPAPLP